MEFEDRNNFEIQRMVDLILEVATNGLALARERESERLDQERDFIEWGPGDKNDEGYLIEELAEPLPTHLSIIKTILLLQSEPVGSDEENIVHFKGLLSARKITNQFIFNIVAVCCDFYSELSTCKETRTSSCNCLLAYPDPPRLLRGHENP